MLSRNPACSRAVKRQIRAPCDSLWISDEILSATFKRFCLVTAPVRRNGSSIPGPLECRRRLGRRRMTGLSEAVYSPIQDFSALWGINRAADRNQWQWEAPSNPPSQAPAGSLPDLSIWRQENQCPSVEDVPVKSSTDQLLNPSRNDHSGIAQDLDDIFAQLQATPDRACGICDGFINNFKQNLVLGLVSEEIIAAALKRFTRDIHETTISCELADSLCVRLYQAVWEGIQSCKVLKVADLNGAFLSRLLRLLSPVIATEEVRSIAMAIVDCASADQLHQMRPGLLKLTISWVSSWHDLLTSVHIRTSNIGDSRRPGTPPTHWLPHPLRDSILALACCLEKLPATLANDIIRDSTGDVIRISLSNFLHKKSQRTIRYSWVLMAANMRCANEDLIVRVWRELDSAVNEGAKFSSVNISRISLHQGSTVFLDYWIRQGQIKSAVDVRTRFEAATLASGPNSAASLLLAINASRELCWKKMRFMFRVLRRIRRPHHIYPILQSLAGSQVKIPPTLVADEIRKHSGTSPRTALNIYRLYPQLRHDGRLLLLDDCSESVIDMIKDSTIHPEELWSVLGTPFLNRRYEAMSRKILPRARVDLIHKMATTFAETECRSRRVALRNVMRCIKYLRSHGEPWSPELTRALCNVGVIKDLVEDQWVGTAKLAWILNLVEEVEGKEVALVIDKAVHCWRQEHILDRERRQGSRSLRRGPID